MPSLPRFSVLVILTAACGTYNANRAALVPRATPRMTSGQPLTGFAQFSAGASSVANLGEPGVGDPDAGIEIPSTQLHSSLKLAPNDRVSFGLLYENGLDRGATPLKSTQPPVENGSVQGYGFSIDVSVPTGDPKWRVGLGLDAMMWTVPYVEFLTCAKGEDCFPFMIEDKGTDNVGTFAASVTPSYRADKHVTVFGGLTVRQHPTLQQKTTEVDPIFDEPEVDSGPFNVIGAAGIEIAFADGGLLASAMAYMDFTGDPAKYKPGLALMLSVPIGKREPKPRPAPVLVPVYDPASGAPPPPPAYPPTYPPPPPPPPPAGY